jgi:hypothetical protein
MSPSKLISEHYIILIEKVGTEILHGRILDKLDNNEIYFVEIEISQMLKKVSKKEIQEGHAFDWKIFENKEMSFEPIKREIFTKEQAEKAKKEAKEVSVFFDSF